MADHIKVGLAQCSPVYLDREKTIAKATRWIESAGDKSCNLVVFGEAFLPAYPFWLSETGGSQFENAAQKQMHGLYAEQSVSIAAGHLKEIQAACADHEIACYLGFVERADNRGGHSLYCSLTYIDPKGNIQSVHRKLMPTYEERLCWSIGDGHGLRVHPLAGFNVGGLNCWENWMPMARSALYGLGENLHVAVWPGSERNTRDITQFMAKESRSFVVSVSNVMKRADLPAIDLLDGMRDTGDEWLSDGGSCVAAPDGSWIIEPTMHCEELFTADLDLAQVRRERQNFDPAGHYARADVMQLHVDRTRQATVRYSEID